MCIRDSSSAICAVEAINDLFRYGSEILTKPAKSLDMPETSLFASKLNSDVQLSLIHS